VTRAVGVVAAAGLAAAGCARTPDPAGAGAATSPPPVITTGPSPSASAVSSSRPVYPLTGLPAGSTADAARPAVALDVSSSSPVGLSSADVVFEEISSPVRYIALYQSRQSVTVGPITSTQPTDRTELDVLHPLIGYDGAAAVYYVPQLDATKIIDAGDGRDPDLYTTTSDGVTTTPQALAGTDKSATAPPPMFSYRSPGGTLASTGVSRPTGVTITIPGAGTQSWSYDTHAGQWTLTSGGPAFSAANLIVQYVSYSTTTINAHRGVYTTAATITGTGKDEIFSAATSGSGGTAASGTWSKPHPTQLTDYLDSSGTPMTLQPGPTWVLLAPTGTQISTSGA
jgi:Protein of unknown function (DUF3048) C-terminal domain/Protein of unknown function (DUF3048) N-terminal domain